MLDGNNAVTATFVYSTSAVTPDYMIRSGVRYRFVVDHVGSVRLVVRTSDGAVVQRLDYDEFGRVLGDTNLGFQPFGFAGGLYDADTGLTKFGVRDYDSVTGRWTNKDPILFRGGTTNLYEYVKGDPINDTDPDGLGPELLWCIPPSPGAPICAAAAAGAATALYGLGVLCAEKLKDAVKDVVDCTGQWRDAINYCRETLQSADPPTGVTGGYSDVMSCARGLVSSECGGNAI
ncbi:MAG: hypothetical protein RL701_2466 [Pseudomonadota bacterium]